MAVCTNALCQGPEQCTQTVQYRSESINYDLGHLDKTIIEILSTEPATDTQTCLLIRSAIKNKIL